MKLDATLVPRSRSGVALAFVWLLLASSSLVFIEPAPYDLLAALLFVVLFAAGLRIPRGIHTPGLLLAIFTLANLISIYLAGDLDRALWYAGVTIYLVLTWLLFCCLVYQDPERVLRVIWSGYLFAATVAAGVGTAAYFHLIPGAEF
ncbi:MAG: hypothetical protein V3S44_07790, partial [Alphaproteobacteria bacterium]